MANRPPSSSVSRPTVRLRPEMRPRARPLGWKDSSSAARSTRRRVSGATSSRALSALDAVATETPARLATSASVIDPVRCRPTETLSNPERRAAS